VAVHFQLTAETAFQWMLRVSSFSALLTSSMWLRRSRELRDGGSLGWDLLRRSGKARRRPRLASILSPLLLGPRYLWLLRLRFAAAAWLVMLGTTFPAVAFGALLLAETVALLGRFRSGLLTSDGADHMEITIQGALLLGFGGSGLRADQTSLIFCALVVLYAYFQAGYTKLRNPSWRHGRYMLAVANTARNPARLVRVLERSGIARIAAWGVIAWELAAPVCLLDPLVALVWLSGTLLFHLAAAYWLDLPRFLPAWGAAYPAIFWLSCRL